MAETIKTILTADASAYEAGFRRGGNALSSHLSREKEYFARSIAGHQDQIRALKMQAEGYTGLAKSLGQTLSIEKEARKLAASGLITEEKALALLREKQSLQRNLAIQAEQEASARQKAARLSKPLAVGLPGAAGELAPLTPQTLQGIDRAIASQRELRRQTLNVGRSGYTGAMGFLAFSQAVEDAQYGIKGVLNNIPQMIMGFGGSMGLAGVISLAAVAAVTLYPHLKRLYGVLDNENVRAAADEWGKIFDQGMAAAGQFERGIVAEREMKQLAEEIEQSLRQRFAVSAQMATYYDEELTATRQTRDMMLEILAAREKLAEAQGNAGAVISIRRQVRGVEDAGLEADLKNRLSEQARASAEITRLDEIRANAAAEAAEAEIFANQQIAEAMRNLAGAKANQASAEADKRNNFNGIGKYHREQEVKDAQANVQAIEEEIKRIKDRHRVAQEASAAQIADLEKTITGQNEKNNAAFQESKLLEKLIAQRKELKEIEDQTAAAANSKAVLEEHSKDATESRRRMAAQAKKERDDLKKEEEKIRNQNEVKADWAVEDQILQLRRDGQSAMADKLKEEVELRKEAVRISEQMGIAERDALQLIRQRKDLMEEMELTRGGLSVRTKKRQEERDLERAQAREDSRQRNAAVKGIAKVDSFRGGKRGLENDELRRKEAERAAAAAKKDPVPAFWEKQLDLQERLVAHFDQLVAF